MKYADIVWDENQNPKSTSYDECYFSIHGGLEETKHVFLDGNNLLKAWENKDIFTICEAGFGTGLNFLATWDLYEKSIFKPKNLYFISIEKEPLSKKDIEKSNPKSLKHLTDKFLKKYPRPIKGFHLLEFENVKLLLCFGDIKEVLSNLTCKVDAWFMDGFSPSKNPSMWDEETILHVKNLSNKNATLATYSVARNFRENLQKHGFFVEKKQGFGMKKHMLFASINNPKTNYSKPWYKVPKPYIGKEKTAIVLGAGIAGSSVAYVLAKEGFKVSVLERGQSSGVGASGNHCGVVCPLITKPDIKLGKMYEMAFLQALDFYEKLGIKNDFFGVKHYAHDNATQKRWDLWQQRGSEIFTCKKDEFGKYFDVKNAGHLSPFKVCQMLINSSKNIFFYPQNEIKSFTCKNDIWEVITDKNIYKAPVLILALGHESQNFISLNTQKIRGQITHLPKILDIKKPICDKGYICPSIDNKQVIGATYIKDDNDLHVRKEDNDINLLHVKKFLPKDMQINSENLDGRVSFRSSSNDRFPIIGGVYDEEFYKNEYKSLPWKKHKPHLFKDASYLPNFYISTAHGSRGLISAFLGANIINAMINSKAIPLQNDILEELHMARFTIRRLSRQEKF